MEGMPDPEKVTREHQIKKIELSLGDIATKLDMPLSHIKDLYKDQQYKNIPANMKAVLERKRLADEAKERLDLIDQAKQHAATSIQTLARGYITRKRVEQLKFEKQATPASLGAASLQRILSDHIKRQKESDSLSQADTVADPYGTYGKLYAGRGRTSSLLKGHVVKPVNQIKKIILKDALTALKQNAESKAPAAVGRKKKGVATRSSSKKL
jgi:hypothetical protein